MEKSADQMLNTQGRSGPSLEGGRAARSHIRYWESAIFQRSRVRRGGRLVTGRDWRIQLQHQGRREEFNLRSANKSTAARLAREIGQYLSVNGWEAAISKYKPGKRQAPGAALRGRELISSVGQLIRAIHATQPLDRSLFQYTRALRQIVAESFLDKSAGDLKYGRGQGHADWIARIDGVPLALVTPERIQRWKIAYLAKAGNTPSEQRSRRISVNSVLRGARSLLNPKRLEFISDSLPPGFRSPFEKVKLEPRQSCRYRSSFDVRRLMVAAREELADTDPQAYKAFLLAVCCGLRRGEIDHLEWRAFGWSAQKLHIEPTEHLAVKTEDSIGEIDLEPELASLFQRFGRDSTSSFVIETPDGDPRPPSHANATPQSSRNSYRYRCQRVFTRLNQWLRAHEVSTLRPLHALRKEYGSQVCDRHGLFAASRALRHADVSVTADFYVDKRSRATPGLGELL
jgi:integrase